MIWWMGHRGGACIECKGLARSAPLDAHAGDFSCMFHGFLGQVIPGAGNTKVPVLSKRLKMSGDWLDVIVVAAA